MGKDYFLGHAIPHFKAIWPWKEDDSFLPPREGDKVTVAQPENSISALAKEFGGADNLSIIYYIMQKNPGVVFPHKIRVN